MQNNSLKAHFYVLLATFLVAGSFIASAKLIAQVNPISLTLLRFLAGTLILAPFILLNPNLRNKILSTMPRAMAISLFYALYFLALFESLKTTTVLNTGTLYTLVPLITAVFAYFTFKESISIKKLLVYIIGLLGTIWVIFRANIELLFAFSLNSGDLIYLLGVLSMAVYSILLKSLYKNDSTILMVFCTLIGGTIWMAIALYIFEEPLNWYLIRGELFYYMSYLVVGTTLITLYLYQKTTVLLGPTKVMSYIYLNPIAVVILLYFLDNEVIELLILPGVLISCIATFILQRR